MPTFYTDPSITLRGMREPESVSDLLMRFAQLRQMAEQSRYNRLREKEAVLRLQEMERGAKEQEAVRGAMAAGVQRAPQISNEVPTLPQFQGVLGPTSRVMAQPPTPGVGFDRQAALANIAQNAPQLVGGMEQDFAAQDAAREKERLEFAKSIAGLEKDKLEIVGKKLKAMGSLAQSVIMNPGSYASAKQMAEEMGLVQPGFLPPQLTPELKPQLEAWAMQSEDYWKMVEDENKKRELAIREKPVLGRDVPLPKDVEAQKERLARAGKTEPLVLVRTQDEQGNPIQKFVPKSQGAQYAMPPTTDTRNRQEKIKSLIPAIDQLDALSRRVITEKQAIAQRAKAAGRSVEAALANDPDYRVYQDARVALAGNLAVAQQGSRPSDADIRAVWLPLVPDVFRDTKESTAMKWDMIRTQSGLPTGKTVRMVAPDGSEADVPADKVAAAEAAGAKRK